MKYFFFLVISLSLLGCTKTLPTSWEKVSCKGRIHQGHYIDKYGLFSIELPNSKLDLDIEERFSDEMGANIIFQCFLDYLHVFVQKLPPLAKLDVLTFKRFFDVEVYPKYVEVTTNPELLYEDVIGDTYFVIYKLPGSSQVVNLGTGEKEPAIRGSLLFQEGDLFVLLSSDQNPFITLMERDHPEISYQKLKEKILEVKKSFKCLHR